MLFGFEQYDGTRWITTWFLGNNRGHPPQRRLFFSTNDKTLVVDLTLEDSSPKPTKQGKFNIYFDQHRGDVVNAWEDDSVEEAAIERCEAVFVFGWGLEQGPLGLRRARMHDDEMSC